MDDEIRLLSSRDKIRDILKKGRYTTLALNDGNDSYILTMNYGLHEEEDILFFECYGSGNKMDFFKSNPYLSGTVIVEEGFEDGESTVLSSVVYSGLLEVLHRSDEKENALHCINRQNSPSFKKRYTELAGAVSKILVMKLTIEELSGKVIPLS